MNNLKAGGLYKNRVGRLVRILSIDDDTNNTYPVVAKVLYTGQYRDNGVMLLTNKGRLDIDCESKWDLMHEVVDFNETM